MTDSNLGRHVQLGENLLAIYVQLTPWVQAFLALVACVLVLGVAYLFKETVATLTYPLIRPPPEQATRDVPRSLLARDLLASKSHDD